MTRSQINSSSGELRGGFVDASNLASSTPTFPVETGQHPEGISVAYSPDLPDGTGGLGAFLVVWSDGAAGTVRSQIVAYPGRLVGQSNILFTRPAGLQIWTTDIAYSPTDRVFLVGWTLVPTNRSTQMVRLDLSGRPLGAATTLSTGPPLFLCGNFEFPWVCAGVSVAWNPISREFGVAFTDGTTSSDGHMTLARVQGNGAVAGRSTVADAGQSYALAINAATGHYVAASSRNIDIIGVEFAGD